MTRSPRSISSAQDQSIYDISAWSTTTSATVLCVHHATSSCAMFSDRGAARKFGLGGFPFKSTVEKWKELRGQGLYI